MNLCITKNATFSLSMISFVFFKTDDFWCKILTFLFICIEKVPCCLIPSLLRKIIRLNSIWVKFSYLDEYKTSYRRKITLNYLLWFHMYNLELSFLVNRAIVHAQQSSSFLDFAFKQQFDHSLPPLPLRNIYTSFVIYSYCNFVVCCCFLLI